jgi:molybdopterin converting factor small subunit
MSPEVTVRFTGELRALAGRASLKVSLPQEATYRDAVVAVAERVAPSFGQRAAAPLLAGSAAAPLLLVNRTLCSGAALDEPAGKGDILAFVLPVEGG